MKSKTIKPKQENLFKEFILPVGCTDTLALGADTGHFAACMKKNCFLSRPFGSLAVLDNLDDLKKAINTVIIRTRFRPQIIVCDLHPGFASTALAAELSKKFSAKLIQIQHHKAHIASVALEHNLNDYVGIAMDGLGYGEDDSLWGGEVFKKTANQFARIGCLEPQPQIGGDSAAIYPKKMLIGILSKILTKEQIIKLRLFSEKETRLYLKQLSEGFNVEQTTSAGRVLDAAAALLNICEKRTFDGEPAIALEKAAGKAEPYPIKPIIKDLPDRSVLSTTGLFRFLLKNKEKPKDRLAATAQIYLAEGLYEIAAKAAKKDKLPIVFAGGVAFNRMISGYMKEKGVLLNRKIPPGDAGIPLGQVYLANQ